MRTFYYGWGFAWLNFGSVVVSSEGGGEGGGGRTGCTVVVAPRILRTQYSLIGEG